MMETERRRWTFPVWVIPAATIGAMLLGAAVLWGYWFRPAAVQVRLTTPYQAVLLANGQLYFGRLEGYGEKTFPVLREVYYIQRGTDAKTSQPTNVLVRRGQEWHGPDHMVLNAAQIVLVEPVTRGSKIMELITGLKLGQ